MEHSENLDQIAPALRKAQSKLGPILKNKSGQYKYADLKAIWAVVQPVLNECLLSVSQGGGDAPQTVETFLIHDGGQWLSGQMHVTAEASKAVSPAQADGIACTYGRRYGLSAILGLQVEDDTDGAYASNRGAAAPPATRPLRDDRAPASPRAEPDTGRSRQATPPGAGPTCPIPTCGAAMTERPPGRKGPHWRCVNSDYRNGEEHGCAGVFWTSEDAAKAGYVAPLPADLEPRDDDQKPLTDADIPF